MSAQVTNDSFSHVFRVKKNVRTFSKLDLRHAGNLKLDKVIVEYEDGTSWSSQEYYETLLKWPMMTALRAGKAGTDVDTLFERTYTPCRKREG